MFMHALSRSKPNGSMRRRNWSRSASPPAGIEAAFTPRRCPLTTHAPLQGLRVVDLTRLLPGPVATLRLAELGADVLKIEEPGAGDSARAILQNPADKAAGQPSTFYKIVNHGKRETRLDLKSETGLTV